MSCPLTRRCLTLATQTRRFTRVNGIPIMAPPKRQSTTRASTPPSAKKSKKASNGSAQTSISSFFSSPSKAKAPQRQNSVISIGSSSDSEREYSTSAKDAGRAPDGDAALARKLADNFEGEVSGGPAGQEAGRKSKGKERDLSPADEDDEIVALDAAPARPGPNLNDHSNANGSLLPSPKVEAKPVHPMFAKREKKDPPPLPAKIEPAMREVKPDTAESSGNITSATSDPVPPIDFDVDAFTFDPTSIDVSTWPKGKLPYSVLVGVYVQVSSTRSRLTITRVLTNFLHFVHKVFPNDLRPTLYLLSNHLLPSYLPCELGIGSSILSKAIMDVSGLQPSDLRRLANKTGDPGDMAFEAKSNLRTLVTPSPLLVGDVYERMLGLSRIKGSNSGKIKGDVVRKLMVQARGEEMRFLVRSLVGNLRIGSVKLTLLSSLARAIALSECPPDLVQAVKAEPPTPTKSKAKKAAAPPKPGPRDEIEARCKAAERLVRKVYVRHPNYGHLVAGIQDGGLSGLDERVPVSVGIPLSPMLGSITRSMNDVYAAVGDLPFTAEAKLDGQRVQIHARLDGPQGEEDGGGRWVVDDDGTRVWVRLFSRHLEDMTEKYPDISQMVLKLLTRKLPASPADFPSTASRPPERLIDLLRTEKITSFVMDAEVVAIDKETGAYRTFQELSNRAKKGVRVEDIKVVVGVYAFDLMLLNDQMLLSSPFSHRRHLLRTLFPPFADPNDLYLARFAHIESIDSTNCTDVQAEMQAFFADVVQQKCEGLMVKLLESGDVSATDGADDSDLSELEDEEGEGGKPKKRSKASKTQEEAKEVKAGTRKPRPSTYEPDQRTMGWLKVKKDYLEGLGDSLDLVPIGAWWGQGRKAGWWSPILLACHNPETGALEAVCKCISGFSDKHYKDMIARYPPENAIPEKCNKDEMLGYYETNGLRPDVWFSPDEVWEIRGADITLSPVYPAAASLLGGERGLSIRFPRFMKFREDKTWEQATTSQQFADMYREQMKAAPARGPAKGGQAAIGGGAQIRQSSEDAEDVDGVDA